MAQEPIEQWRAEFKALIDDNTDIPKSYRNNYWINIIEDRWQGFLMAKRSQKTIELPEQNPMIFSLRGYEANDLHDAITAAGYQFKVKD